MIYRRWLIVAAIGLVGLWWWHSHLAHDPKRVFAGMLNQSLATQSVVLKTSGQQGNDNLDQLVQYQLGNNLARSLTTLRQNDSTIETEILATPTTDYTRYLKITTNQKTAAGHTIDTSKITNLWAASGDGKQPTGQLFSQAITGIGLPIGAVAVPIGALPHDKRSELIDQISGDNVYQVNYSNVQKKRVNGRLQYTYQVGVQVIPYIHMLKTFAHDLGITQLDQVDPNNYRAGVLNYNLTVDVAAHQLVSADNKTSGYTEEFVAYNVPINQTIPIKTITPSELRQRFTSL